MPSDQEISPNVGARVVFNGIHSKEIFSAESVPLPDLAPGEILVKVISYFSAQ